MTAKIYRVKLTEQERQTLKDLVSKGRTAARKQNHARILLLSDENNPDGSKKDKEIQGGGGGPAQTLETEPPIEPESSCVQECEEREKHLLNQTQVEIIVRRAQQTATYDQQRKDKNTTLILLITVVGCVSYYFLTKKRKPTFQNEWAATSDRDPFQSKNPWDTSSDASGLAKLDCKIMALNNRIDKIEDDIKKTDKKDDSIMS